MNAYRSLFVGAVALAIGAALGIAGLAHAQLGNGQGAGAEAIGAALPSGETEAARAAAPRAAGQCITNRTAFRTQTNEVQTGSLTFVTMPNTHYPITHTAGCLIVDFAGETLSPSNTARLDIRAFIQGIGAAEPVVARMGRFVATGILEVRSMRFVFPNVPAGTHTVRIDWRSPDGSIVAASNRTLTIQYR